MNFSATVELNPTQIKEIICDYLSQHGVHGVSRQDIDFVIKEVVREDQIDPWKEYSLTSIRIKNVKIGKEGV